MKWLDAILGTVLFTALFFCVISLDVHIGRLNRTVRRESIRTERSDVLMFQSVAGLSSRGNLIPYPSTSTNQRSLVCGLKSETLNADIGTLTEASENIAVKERLRVVAFCLDSVCRAAIQQESRTLPFTTVTHGEVVSSQAMASADDRGECILLDPGDGTIRKIAWRNGANLRDIARELGR